MTDYETAYRALREGVEARARNLDQGDSIDKGIAADLRTLLAPSPAEGTGEACNCGWGGVHDPDNPRCAANAPAPMSSGEAGKRAACTCPRDSAGEITSLADDCPADPSNNTEDGQP